MHLAGGADLDVVLEALRRARPVFHSEADFQHAFAWEAQRAMTSARVRLETRPAPGMRLDVLVASANGALRSAIELKYLTRAWSGDVGGEAFELKKQSAQDIRAYDVIKDIARVENNVQALSGCNGAVVVLSNDSSYWNPPRHDRETNAAAFRLHEGRRVDGVRTWGPNTGAGTMHSRQQPIALSGSYELRWRDYSRLPGAAGVFRLLVVEVASCLRGR